MIQISGQAPSTRQYEADLLLVLPVCLGQGENGLLFESQACNGIERWAENFERLLVICPLLSAEQVRQSHSVVWKPVSEIPCIDRVRFVPLPYATSPVPFFRVLRHCKGILHNAIEQSKYLCFAIGGLFGDWGAIACLEAKRMGRPYAVWTDRVEHQVETISSSQATAVRRLKTKVRSRLMYSLERRCISNSALGLFHGASCYEQYAPWCETSYVVHDVHTKRNDAISYDALQEKCRDIEAGAPIKIAYVGRADSMKGPIDWIEVMARLKKREVPFEATWLGDGPMLEPMRAEVTRRGLEDVVTLPGFVSHHNEVLTTLRNAHLLAFCHKTLESPRCHVEAYISGCPIVGYTSTFAADLTENGGGVFVPLNDAAGLATQICQLNADRQQFAELVCAAARSGERFNDVAVFEHRSNLIKKHL